MRLLRCLALLAVFAAPAAGSGAIRGTLWPERAEARRARSERQKAPQESHGLFGILRRHREPPPAGSAPMRNREGDQSVILVRSVPASFERKLVRSAPTEHRIVISGGHFIPPVLVVVSGESITIENRDSLWHDVFSVVPGSRFDSGKLGPGATKTVKLRRTGTIPLHCDFHAPEVGFIRVAANHAFTQPDSLGRFRVPDLPPGDYQIELWHPWRGTRVTSVTVPHRGDGLCDLAF